MRLSRIAPDDRKEEKELFAELETAKPYIVGAMFTAASEAMQYYPQVHLRRLPRMADWTRWGCAVAEALGYGSEQFLSAYASNRKAQNAEALGAHPLGAALVAFMKDRDEWSDRPTQLLVFAGSAVRWSLGLASTPIRPQEDTPERRGASQSILRPA